MATVFGGVLVLDKPEGLSSARALEQVKRVFKIKKAGHSGTLDPFASGVLICCLGRATRLTQFFLHGAKRYRAVLHLGVETDTQDPTGTVTATAAVPELDPDAVRSMMDQFLGAIEQSPPVYSALKHGGVPLYRLARSGKPVQKPPRRVVIEALKLMAVEGPDVHFEVACSGGTYIRTLCADMGRTIGCGGHLKRLRRIRCSGFDIGESVSLKTLVAAQAPERYLLRPEAALREMPELVADARTAARIKDGKPIRFQELAPGIAGATATTLGIPRLFKVVAPYHGLIAVIEERETQPDFDYRCVFPEAWS